jgi:hypothetical protein
MKMTAQDLAQLGVIDRIVPEPVGGAHRDPQAARRRSARRSARSSTRSPARAAKQLRRLREDRFLAIGEPRKGRGAAAEREHSRPFAGFRCMTRRPVAALLLEEPGNGRPSRRVSGSPSPASPRLRWPLPRCRRSRRLGDHAGRSAAGRAIPPAVARRVRRRDDRIAGRYVEQIGKNIAVQSGLANSQSAVHRHAAQQLGRQRLRDTRRLRLRHPPAGLADEQRGRAAGVLGHEVGHVARRHSKARERAAQRNSILGVLGQVLAGAVLATARSASWASRCSRPRRSS